MKKTTMSFILSFLSIVNFISAQNNDLRDQWYGNYLGDCESITFSSYQNKSKVLELHIFIHHSISNNTRVVPSVGTKSLGDKTWDSHDIAIFIGDNFINENSIELSSNTISIKASLLTKQDKWPCDVELMKGVDYENGRTYLKGYIIVYERQNGVNLKKVRKYIVKVFK